jgi:hypothetical protein
MSSRRKTHPLFADGPKAPRWTPQQEEALQAVEVLQTRATILEKGVSRIIDNEFNSDGQREECARALADACKLRRDAGRMQQQLQDEQREKPKKRKAPTK